MFRGNLYFSEKQLRLLFFGRFSFLATIIVTILPTIFQPSCHQQQLVNKENKQSQICWCQFIFLFINLSFKISFLFSSQTNSDHFFRYVIILPSERLTLWACADNRVKQIYVRWTTFKPASFGDSYRRIVVEFGIHQSRVNDWLITPSVI